MAPDVKDGDLLRAKDWNALFKEVARLDKAKVDRDGDTIAGTVTVSQLSVDRLTVRQKPDVPATQRLALLGMATSAPFPFTIPQGYAVLVRVEQYTVGSGPRLFPAFIRLLSWSPAARLETGVDRVTYAKDAVSGMTVITRELFVSRSSSMPQAGDINVTAVVVSAAGADVAQPSVRAVPG
jgi:hypothetical protein